MHFLPNKLLNNCHGVTNVVLRRDKCDFWTNNQLVHWFCNNVRLGLGHGLCIDKSARLTITHDCHICQIRYKNTNSGTVTVSSIVQYEAVCWAGALIWRTTYFCNTVTHTFYLSQTPQTCLCKNFLSGVNFFQNE